MGQVILLTGKRGDGKSTFMSQLICEALDQGESVFVYSGELADYHFKRWLDYQLAGNKNIIESRNIYGDPVYTLPNSVIEKINHWYAGRAYIYDNSYVPDDSSELESITDTIEGVIRQYGVKLVCIDNLMTAMDVVERQDNLYLAQSNFVGKPNHFAVRQYKKYKLAAGKTAKSILISCGARLAPFDIQEVRDITAYDELQLDTLGDKKTALFLIMSDTDATFNFLISMILFFFAAGIPS